MVPLGDQFHFFLGAIFASIFRPPKNIEKVMFCSAPSWVERTLSPPSSDSSLLVNPLRVLPAVHRTPWQSQSFPEQQTSALSQQQTPVSTADICPISTADIWLLWGHLGEVKNDFDPFFTPKVRKMEHAGGAGAGSAGGAPEMEPQAAAGSLVPHAPGVRIT